MQGLLFWPIRLQPQLMYRLRYESRLGNPNVTWETAEKSNIGFIANFWKDKITAEFDLFTEHRTGILSRKGTVSRASLRPICLFTT